MDIGKKIIVIISIIILGMFISSFILLIVSVYIDTRQTSSPVEEMYHRQLVVTLDSILDARFGSGCCEEVIDSDDVSVPHTRFGDILSPME